MKIKVIHIAHASHSYLADEKDDLKKLIINDWYGRVARQIKKFNPKIEIECWSPEKKYKKEVFFIDEDIKFRIFPTTFSPIYALDFSIPMLLALNKEIKKSKKENYKLIFHLHEYHNLHGLLISYLFKKEKIIAQHHGGSWPLKHLKENKKYRPFFLFFLIGQLLENFVLKNIQCFFALSKKEIDYLNKKAPNSKIKFQTMGIENSFFNKSKKLKSRKRLGLLVDKKILIYIGRIDENKGLKYLIDAMEKLKDIDLKIIGYGIHRKRLEDYSVQKNLKNIEFLGTIYGKRKLLYLNSADALILPSLKEGAPVVIMEALAKNLPVVVTDVGGVSLMVNNKINGIIIKQKSSEEIVRGVKSVLNMDLKDIKKYAKPYKWEEIIKNTLKEYENLN